LAQDLAPAHALTSACGGRARSGAAGA